MMLTLMAEIFNKEVINFIIFSSVCIPCLTQVRKRPLNKKESAKNEEDIIQTHANSLTVHETKLKVDFEDSYDGGKCSRIICLSRKKVGASIWK